MSGARGEGLVLDRGPKRNCPPPSGTANLWRQQSCDKKSYRFVDANKPIGSPSPPKPCLQAPRDTSRPRAQPCSRFLTKFVSFIAIGISLVGPQTCASNRLSVPFVLDISSGENALHTRISGSRLCYHITFGIGLELPLYQCRSWVVTDCVK